MASTTISGGDGNDTLSGGSGNDIMSGGSGNDVLKGEAGDDNLQGELGDDVLEGGAGDDTLAEVEGNNTLSGGDGNDAFYAEGGYNQIDGGAGNDWIRAFASDIILAGDGDDSIRLRANSLNRSGSADGGAGKDSFEIDLVRTAATSLVLKGGSGSDVYALLHVRTDGQGSYQYVIADFAAGAGGDQIELDWLVSQFSSGSGNPFAANGFLRLQADGADTLLVLKHGGDSTLLRFQNVAPSQFTAANFVGGYAPNGSAQGLSLQGTEGPDNLKGAAADDKLFGAGGSDRLEGGGGNDLLEGGPESIADGSDELHGGDGNDILRGGAAADLLQGGQGNDLLEGGTGDDVLIDDEGANALRGGAGADDLTMNGGSFVADGGSGDDFLWSSGSSGTMDGGAGKDLLTMQGYVSPGATERSVLARGGDGDDRLVVDYAGGTGSTLYTLTGGAGADIFAFKGSFASGSWNFTISDFSAALGDRLELARLLPATFEGNPFGASGHLKLEQIGADTVLWFDRDGAAGATASPVKVVTLQGVLANSLSSDNFVEGYAPDGSAIGKNLIGTAGNDTLTGTPMNDTISGLAGQDRLTGGDGDDTLNGGDEADTAVGDDLDGGAGNDILNGGAGRDTLRGGSGDDRLSGGTGDDTLHGNEGNNVLDGGAGKDQLSAGAGNDTLFGGVGDDTLDSGSGNDRLEGGDGNDVLRAGAGISTLNGDAGDDQFRLSASTGDLASNRLIVSGGSGNDTVTISSSYATIDISGGTGRDTYIFQSKIENKITIKDFTPGDGGDILDVMALLPSGLLKNPFGTAGYLRMVFSGNRAVLEYDQDGAAGSAYGWHEYAIFDNISIFQFNNQNFVGGIGVNGSNVGYTLTGSGADDVFKGAFLDDHLKGMGGNDTLTGGAGNDRLEGGAGDDSLQGEAGDDFLFGGDGHDILGDSAGSNQLDGGAGDDKLTSGGEGNSSIVAGEGNDRITVFGGHCIIAAEGGADTIELIFSGAAPAESYVVVADGGAGDDVFRLSASLGIEGELWGGTGRDTYVLAAAAPANKYLIKDFSVGPGGDRIDFTALLGGEQSPSNPFAAGGVLRLQQDGANTSLYWDSDGNGSLPSALVITLWGVEAGTLTGDNFAGGYRPDGSSYGTAVTGGNENEMLAGSGIHDTINGAGGGDRIFGYGGNDVLNGDAGNDQLDGGAGDDVLDGGSDHDHLYDAMGNNTLRGGEGNDNLQSTGTGSNVLEGGSGNDALHGGHGTDTLDGGEGDDRLTLSAANQIQPSDVRTVKAFGGNGNDTLVVNVFPADKVTAEVWGGAGADIFVVGEAARPSPLFIQDFDQASGDKIAVLNALSVLNGYSGGNPFASGVLRLVQLERDTQVWLSLNSSEIVWFTLRETDASTLTYQAFHDGFDPRASAGVSLSGTAQTDNMVAGEKADILSGDGGDDILQGLGGNDLLNGGAGNDQLDGGAGIDTALLQSALSATKVWVEDGAFHVQDLNGAGGIDVLRGIERLQLADAHIALDVDGNAGKIYRIYQAAFDRKPDGAGIGFWIAQADHGVGIDQIAMAMIQSQEFKTLYGAAPSNQEFVARLYQNVLDRAGDKAGVDFWLGVLDSKAAGFADVLAAFSESAENVGNVAQVIGNGFAYAAWLG